MTQEDFNKFLAVAMNTVPDAGSADLTTRTNPKILMFSPVAGAGLQLKKTDMQTLLRQAVAGDTGETRLIVTLTQASTSAPVVTELVDEPVTVLTPAYTSPGLYTLTAASAIFVAGTRVKIHQNVAGSMFTAALTSTSVITITSRTEDGTSKLLVGTDALLATTLLEIIIPSGQ